MRWALIRLFLKINYLMKYSRVLIFFIKKHY